MKDNQQNMVVDLVMRSPRPQFISDQFLLRGKSAQKYSQRKGKGDYSLTRKLRFVDVIESMIDIGTHSTYEIIEMMRLMHNGMDRVKMRFEAANDDDDDPNEKLLDYEELFKLFVQKRKIKLLRFLFSLDRKVFDFHPALFLRTLEYECYDMAALLFKEFFRQLRVMEPQQLEFALSQIVSSYNRANGMLDFKAYLMRQFTE